MHKATRILSCSRCNYGLADSVVRSDIMDEIYSTKVPGWKGKELLIQAPLQ